MGRIKWTWVCIYFPILAPAISFFDKFAANRNISCLLLVSGMIHGDDFFEQIVRRQFPNRITAQFGIKVYARGQTIPNVFSFLHLQVKSLMGPTRRVSLISSQPSMINNPASYSALVS
jgi:hypothetical protein